MRNQYLSLSHARDKTKKHLSWHLPSSVTLLENFSYNIKGTFSRVYIFSFKHSRLGNFLKVMQTLDCVSGSHNFLKFSQPPLVRGYKHRKRVRVCKHRKRVLHCLSSNRLSTKLSRHICSVWRKTIYFTTILLRHRKLFHSQIILALGNFCESLMALHSSTTFFVVSSRWLQGFMKSDHWAIAPQSRIEIRWIW